MCIIVKQHSIMQSELLVASFSENEANVLGTWLKQSFIAVIKLASFPGPENLTLTPLRAWERGYVKAGYLTKTMST